MFDTRNQTHAIIRASQQWPGASNTFGIAVQPPRQRGFVTSELNEWPTPWGVHSFGRDGQNGNVWRMAIPMFETSRPPAMHSNMVSGFEVSYRSKTMTKVIPLASPRADNPVQSSAQNPTDSSQAKGALRSPLNHAAKGGLRLPLDRAATCGRSPHDGKVNPPHFGEVQRQQAIENALSMALYFVRQPGDTAANVWAATARTNRALTLLKQASQGDALASTANTFGRA
jgi:hypothetical protein